MKVSSATDAGQGACEAGGCVPDEAGDADHARAQPGHIRIQHPDDQQLIQQRHAGFVNRIFVQRAHGSSNAAASCAA